MATSWVETLQSKIVTFVVGEGKKEFQVHASALSKLSKPLDVLLNGQMKEAREGRVKWPDIDEQTFVRFIEWVYSKTYDVPEPDMAVDQAFLDFSNTNSTNNTAPQAHTHGLKMPATNHMKAAVSKCPKCNVVATKTCSMACQYCGIEYNAHCCTPCGVGFPYDCNNCRSGRSSCPACGTRAESIWLNSKRCSVCLKRFQAYYCQCTLVNIYFPEACVECFNKTLAVSGTSTEAVKIRKFMDMDHSTTFVPRSNARCTEDYPNIFLCHAHLYIVGDKYLIPDLKQLAFDRLHATLKDSTFY